MQASAAVGPPTSIGIVQENLNPSQQTVALTLTGVLTGGGGLYVGSVSGSSNQLFCTSAETCVGPITLAAPNPAQFSDQCDFSETNDYGTAIPGSFPYGVAVNTSLTITCNAVSINGGAPTDLVLHGSTVVAVALPGVFLTPGLGVYTS
jgi:hypothetical protein